MAAIFYFYKKKKIQNKFFMHINLKISESQTFFYFQKISKKLFYTHRFENILKHFNVDLTFTESTKIIEKGVGRF